MFLWGTWLALIWVAVSMQFPAVLLCVSLAVSDSCLAA